MDSVDAGNSVSRRIVEKRNVLPPIRLRESQSDEDVAPSSNKSNNKRKKAVDNPGEDTDGKSRSKKKLRDAHNTVHCTTTSKDAESINEAQNPSPAEPACSTQIAATVDADSPEGSKDNSTLKAVAPVIDSPDVQILNAPPPAAKKPKFKYTEDAMRKLAEYALFSFSKHNAANPVAWEEITQTMNNYLGDNKRNKENYRKKLVAMVQAVREQDEEKKKVGITPGHGNDSQTGSTISENSINPILRDIAPYIEPREKKEKDLKKLEYSRNKLRQQLMTMQRLGVNVGLIGFSTPDLEKHINILSNKECSKKEYDELREAYSKIQSDEQVKKSCEDFLKETKQAKIQKTQEKQTKKLQSGMIQKIQDLNDQQWQKLAMMLHETNEKNNERFLSLLKDSNDKNIEKFMTMMQFISSENSRNMEKLMMALAGPRNYSSSPYPVSPNVLSPNITYNIARGAGNNPNTVGHHTNEKMMENPTPTTPATPRESHHIDDLNFLADIPVDLIDLVNK